MEEEEVLTEPHNVTLFFPSSQSLHKPGYRVAKGPGLASREPGFKHGTSDT